jgi:NADH-quinone oxidoreductase subunit M
VLLAYSSISHINLGLYGLRLVSSIRGAGNILLGLRHGYISALLFFLVGTIYHFVGSRQVFHLMGIIAAAGVVTFSVSLLILGNIGIPPFLSFWRELLLVLRVLSSMQLVLVGVSFYFIFSFYYCIYLIVHVTKHGDKNIFNDYMLLYLMVGLIMLLNLLVVYY